MAAPQPPNPNPEDIIDPHRAAAIRSFGGLPGKPVFDPPPPDLVHAIVTGTGPALQHSTRPPRLTHPGRACSDRGREARYRAISCSHHPVCWRAWLDSNHPVRHPAVRGSARSRATDDAGIISAPEKRDITETYGRSAQHSMAPFTSR